MEEKDITARVAVHEQQIRSLEARVKTIEDLRESIGDLKLAVERQTGNIDRLAEIVAGIGERQKDHETRIDAIEAQPAQRWEDLTKQVITILIAAAVGAFLAHFGL